MICKKCGAYNPDHATFCKVCAANLKEQSDTEDAVQVAEADEVVEEKIRPKQGNVKAPNFSAARRAGSFKAALKVEEPVEEDHEEAEKLDEEEEQPVSSKSRFSRPAAPVKKRRIVDEADDDDDEDDEDEYDEEDTSADKLESEPKTARFARSSRKTRRVVEEEEDDDDQNDDDEDDDEYEDDGYDDDNYEDDEDDDGYEEYEPTPPRRKKSARSQSKNNGGFNIVTLLIVCLLAILLIIVGIVAFCNIKGGATKSKLPGFLQFNCSGKASTEKTNLSQQQEVVPPANSQNSNPADAPVTGTTVDYLSTQMDKDAIDKDGKPCISISMTSRPGDTVTIVLPNQDDYVVQNTESVDQAYVLTIPKSCFFPKKPLSESVYTVTPQILVAHADGTQDSLQVDSFDLTFPTVQLELTDPAQATIPEEGIMAAEGNDLLLKGKVDDHTVTVTVNGDRVANMYTDGYFDYTYSLAGEEAETVTIEAQKDDYVSTSYSFTVLPYVFIPEKMTLNVVSDVSKLKADKNNKVNVTGTTVPGTTLTATPAAEYQSSVACGAPVVDAEGNFSFEVTFVKDYYGIATITIHAKKDGYEEGEATCTVSRMYADRSKAVTGFNKTKSYHEVPSYGFEKVLENPTASGLYRFEGSIASIDPETGVITFAARTNRKNLKETTNIYVVNVSTLKPKEGAKVKLYCTLNGLYTDGTSLYVTAWFYV